MQVQGMLPSPPHLPTPTQRYVCACTVANVCKSKVCYHPHPNPKVCACVCVQLGQGMLPSPPHPPTPNHPPTPTQRYVCVYGWKCMQVQGMLPSQCTVGNVCKSKVCYHPHPTHPPTPPTPTPPTHTNQRGTSERKTEAQVRHARHK